MIILAFFSFASCVGLCAVAYQIDVRMNPRPPGYSDLFDSSAWDTNSISEFLGVQIPADASNLQIEGEKGFLSAAYGTIPRLQFSFHAPPESATTFVQHFCSGTLHPGYNPLESEETLSPRPDSVLIRGRGTIHYSHSPGVPQTIRGNRCVLRDRTFESFLHEIVLDTSNPDNYIVHYRLPYRPNGNPGEFYIPAQVVTPLGDEFRLYVTGLQEETSSDDENSYRLTYPTICLETAPIAARRFDHWHFNPPQVSYIGAAVDISIDRISQPAAIINDASALVYRSTENDTLLSKWNYCLTDNWEIGTHTVEMSIRFSNGEPQNYEWAFEVIEG
jgi:hypothetical protein